MLDWTIEKVRFDLKYNWKLSRNETTFKENFIVTISDGIHKGTGEIAPNIRYGETPENIQSQFDEIKKKGLNEITTWLGFQEFIGKQSTLSNSLRFGLDSSVFEYDTVKNNTDFNSYFQIPKANQVATCYTIPILDPSEIKKFITDNKLDRFAHLKIKINQESGLDCIQETVRHYHKPIMIDANEAWTDVEDLLKTIHKCNKHSIVFIEQPMPNKCVDEYVYLKKESLFDIFADESITNQEDLYEISRQFHGVNMKLMKTGGYAQGIKILEEAKKLKLKTMVGCMVESTLGISKAMNFGNFTDYADLDGFMLIKNEPFKLIREDKGLLYFN